MSVDQQQSKLQRILIVGPPGAGKSLFGKKLAKCLNQPLYHLDDYYWLPGWQRIDKRQWLQILRELCSNKNWIIDGNHAKTFAQRAIYADTIVMLDYSPLLCLWRFCKRSIKRYFKINDNLPINIQNDSTHKPIFSIQWHILRLILKYRFKTKGEMLKISNAIGCSIVVLKSDKHSEKFINHCKSSN